MQSDLEISIPFLRMDRAHTHTSHIHIYIYKKPIIRQVPTRDTDMHLYTYTYACQKRNILIYVLQ